MSSIRLLSKKYSVEERPSYRTIFKQQQRTVPMLSLSKTSSSKKVTKSRASEFDLHKTKRRIQIMGMRSPTSILRPDQHFRVISDKHKPVLESLLMEGFFGCKIDEISDDEVHCAENEEESMELVKLGKSVRMSKAVISYLSDTQKSNELTKNGLFTPWDMNSSHDFSLKAFKTYVSKISARVAGLSVKPSAAMELRACLNRIREIIDEAGSGTDTANVSKNGREVSSGASNA